MVKKLTHYNAAFASFALLALLMLLPDLLWAQDGGGLEPLVTTGEGIEATFDRLKLPIFLITGFIVAVLVLAGWAGGKTILAFVLGAVILGNLDYFATWFNIA